MSLIRLDPPRAGDLPPKQIARALDHTRDWVGPDYLPGGGNTAALWSLLAATAACDVAVARAVEPVLDARAILDQAGLADDDLPGDLEIASTWGVFAAEGPGEPLRAHRSGRGWQLKGTKPWCSLAADLEGALVTAHLDDGERRLFAVDLCQPEVEPASGTWVSRGLQEIPSLGVSFHQAPALPVGEAGWYLTRPGFWWGGIGVAACWYGGAAGIARRVRAEALARPGTEMLEHALGRVTARLAEARRALEEGADAVDGTPRMPGRLVAKLVRTTVAEACEDVMRTAAQALGPAPLTQEEDYAKTQADLAVYLRQHHPWREAVSLGRAVAEGEEPW